MKHRFISTFTRISIHHQFSTSSVFFAFSILLLCVNNETHSQWVQTGGPNNVRRFATNGSNLFAGTDDAGVFLSTNNGTSWTAVNNGLTNTSVFSILISNTSLFAGTIGGGVFLTTNNGANWTAVNNGLTNLSVFSLAVSPGGADLYAGTGGGGVFRSTNNGASWAAVNNGLTSVSVFSLAVSPDGTNLFAGTLGGGVFLSTNNGTNWTAVNNSLTGSNIRAFAFSANGTNLFAATLDGGVFLTTNNGASWAGVNNGFTSTDIRSLAAVPNGAGGTNLFAGGNGSGVFLTTNNGANWTAVNSGLTAMAIFSLTLSPDGTSLLAGTIGARVWRRPLSEFGSGGLPATPALLSPPDGATNLPMPITLRWNSSTDATSYRLQLSSDSTFAQSEYDVSALTDTSFLVTDLSEGTRYHWHISAENSMGTSAYSLRRQFRTAGVPRIQVNPLFLNFGNVTLGSTVLDTITIFSVGTDPLVVGNVRIVGASASEFAVFGSQGPFPPTSPNSSFRIVVRFAPTVTGPKAAGLVIGSNATPGSDSVSLIGSSSPSSIGVTTLGTPIAGGGVRLGVKIPPNFTTQTESLLTRKAGEVTYLFSRPVRVAPDSFVVDIDSLTVRGVEYYLAFVDVQGLRLTFPESNPATNPAPLGVLVVSARSAFSLPAQQYKMASIPLSVRRNGTSEILTDDFGPYQRNVWRLFRWQNGGYVEHPGIAATSAPGNAAWVITSGGGFFDVDSGRSVASSSPYILTLPPNDWAQVANPFAFPVDWRAITKSGSVKGPYYFDGGPYVLDTTTALAPWEGYFVFNEEAFPVTLTVPVLEASPTPRPPHQANAPGECAIRFSAYGQGANASHNDIYLGFRIDATEEYDGYDYPFPPPSPEDNTRLVTMEGGRECMMNFKPPSERGASWELKIIAGKHAGRIKVATGIMGELPAGHHVFVYDIQDGRVVAREGGSFALESFSGLRTMKVIVGTMEYARHELGDIPLQPIEFDLQQNYPNPFNPTTTIRYQLGKQGMVVLEIFNMLGQHVKTLVNEEQSTGVYSTLWDGRNDAGRSAASGIYLYRLRAGDFVAARKLVLLH